MLDVRTDGSQVWFGDRFTVTFQRTLRIPDDGRKYPLPPSLGNFPIQHVADYKRKVPSEWAKRGGVFIPMYQREALWISFDGESWRPNAVKVGVGKINAVSGKPWTQEIRKEEQDYLVCPPQPWLDGINAGKDYVRQFVAMPLGQRYTVEGQVTGEEEWGGIQICVFEPKAGKFHYRGTEMLVMACLSGEKSSVLDLGIALGGMMKQRIYPDPHGFDTWDAENYGRLYVHIVNSEMYRKITGTAPPPTPIDAKQYTAHGLPWFELYDDDLGDLAPPSELSKLKSVKAIDKKKGIKGVQDDTPVAISYDEILGLLDSLAPIKKPRTVEQG
jgi:hypothetical protein